MKTSEHVKSWPTLASMPTPVKMLFTAILLTLSLAMFGAMGQIMVHDIVPTFFSGGAMHDITMEQEHAQISPSAGRGDLFSITEKVEKPKKKTLMENDQFIWTLKWSHIHLFGMNMIFFFLGAVTIFLDIDPKAKSWLIVLPFVGVVIDIASMWLKAFISPVFFWLHVPGGGLFASIFVYVFFRGLKEMWLTSNR